MDYADIAPMMRHLWSPVVAVGSAWQGVDSAILRSPAGVAQIDPAILRSPAGVAQVDPAILRSPAGVAQIHNAQIAVAVAGASIVPQRPRVIVQIYKRNYSHELINASRAFALSFLGPGQLELMHALGFASGRGRRKLEGIPYRLGATGSPILEGCWGYLDCRVVNQMDGGDMTCFLAEVVDGATVGEAQPLWWQEARARMPAAWQREWDVKMQLEVAFSREHMDEIQR